MPTRRVRRPRDKEQLLRDLTGDDGPFETYRDVLGFAAALGFERGRREPFDQSAGPIAWEVFVSGAGNEALVDLIGVAATESVEVLANDRFDERLTAFEEYANGGLAVLGEEIGQMGGKVRDAVLHLVLSSEGESGDESEIDLERMARELAW